MRSVIRFLNARNIKPADIHHQLCEVYGDDAISDGMVRRWVRKFNEGRISVHDEQHTGWPSLIIDDLVRAVDEKIHEDRRFTISSLSLNFPQMLRSGLQACEFYNEGIERLVPRLDKCLNNGGDYDNYEDILPMKLRPTEDDINRMVSFWTLCKTPADSKFSSDLLLELVEEPAENVPPIDIHRRLKAIYHDQCVDISTVRRWSARARNEPGATLNLYDKGRSERPRIATDDTHRNHVNELITVNHRITHEHLPIQCGISRECVQAITAELGFQKICT
ncbi:hypothetical protein ANN_02965 [Periplaneta americana]|uniref:Mos1 transposase HTH domain-containing protein n=1 Tax=Periplaneta americana TaxID=6978 RepID=A0ABQ8U0W3_PERAM|nr:hypothetical protein ANN_02965 [Periplaneta americana]